jgi:uncharacterized RDD family membrane protein YckC
MYCSKCGANVAEGAAFCAACGAPMSLSSAGATGANPPATPGYVQPASVPPAYSAAAPIASPGAAIHPTVGYAGFWLRFVAVLVDFILIYFVRRLIFLPFGIEAGMGMHGLFHGRHPQDFGELLPLLGLVIRVAIISAILQWLYFSLMESSVWQATIGKKLLGLTVTDLEGRRISFGRATGRYFAKILSTLILFIGYLMAGFTEKKQALHDMIAGTLVLRKL